MIGADGILSLALPKSDDAGVWRFTVSRAIALGPPDAKHASGGSILDAAIHALEKTCARPLIQANATFLKAPRVGETCSIEVSLRQEGRAISIAEALVSQDGESAATIQATLGARPSELAFQWESAHPAADPDDCAPIPFVRADPGDLHTELEMRLISGPGDHECGRMAFWLKALTHKPLNAAFLAIAADYAPEAIHLAIARKAGAVSFDNTLRIVKLAPTDWIRCETRLAAIHGGHFHAGMHIFARDGTLLATAAQSGVVRLL
jgi:acyl-CoA thioesterase II